MKKRFTLFFASLLACVGVMHAQVVASLSDLSNDKVYTLKSGRSSDATAHYLLYHTDAPNNLSSTYSGQGHSMAYSDATTNFQFAIYKHSDKYYFFNIAAEKFIGNNDNNNGAIPLVDMPTNAIEIRSSNNATYNFVLSTNGTGALNAAETQGCHGVVNWTGGYNDLGDAGNIYLISAVADLDAQLKALIEEKLNASEVLNPARAAVESASTTLVGAYTPDAVAGLSAALEAYDANETSDNFNAVKTAYDALLTSGEKVALAAGEQFTVKCVEDTRGYMVYSTVEGKGSETQAYLAGSNKTENHAAIDAEGIYKEWAIVAHNGKNYMYNVQNKKFITSDGVVQFSETPYAFQFISIGDNLFEIQFENNRYLSFSPGWGADCVRTEPGVDNGCKFYIEKTGVAVPEDVVSIVEASLVKNWQDEAIAKWGYVGGYPASMVRDIKAVSTLEGTVQFDTDNADQKLALTAGDYYIKGTGVGNNANWYLTYNSEGKLMAAELTEGEKLSSKHVWSFETIEDEDGYKLKSKDLDKYADALIKAGDPTYIKSDYASGAKYTFTDNGSAKYIIKDGNNHVMRTENSGVINYWDAEVNEAWYLISVSAVEAYDLSGLVEGEWEDITNDDVIVNPDLSSLEAWGSFIWNATNNTSYDAERGVMEFVAGENTEASLEQNEVPFAKGTYRLTGKAYHKGAVNAVMFVGDKEVEIPEAEDFVEVTLEFTAEGAQYGTDYLNLGYSCDFDNAEDILVVGGFKLESKESLTLEEKFKSVYDGNGMPNDNTFAYYDWDLQNTYKALYPAYQPVLAAAQEISTALNAGELVLKSDVEQSVADMEAMLAEIKAIVKYAQTTLMGATSIAYSILGTLEESDPDAVAITEAIAATEDMSTVTAVADLEAMVADINEAIAPYCDLSEGTWLDVTADYVVNGDLSSTEGWTISVTPQDTRTDLRVIEYWVGGQANGGKVSQSVSLPAGEYRLTGKSLYRQGWAWDANKEKSLGYMFAGENKVLVKTLGSLELDAYPDNVSKASAAFYEKDLYSNELNITLAEEGTVEIGYETAFDAEGGSWFIFGAMKLEKKLTLKDKFLADLEAFAAFAENPALEVLAAQESKVDDLLWEANKLKADIVAGKSVLKADVEKAVEDMAAVTAEVTVCINYYDKSFAPALSAAEEILAKSTAGAEDVAAFDAALKAATKDMWKAAEVADLEARVAALETARQAYVVKAVPEEGFTLDYTFLIKNAQVTSADGWTNANIAETANYTGAPDAKAIDIGWNATVNVYQEIAGLPAGQYVLSAIARSKSPESTIYMTANGITVNVAFPQNDAAGGALGGGWEEVRTDTISVVDGNLTIGLDVKNSGEKHIGADNFHLYYVGELPHVETTGVKLDQDKVTLRFVGDVVQLNATIEPADASDRTLEWGTSNDAVASVDANGLVTAVGAGTATITVATENGMEATCAVTVEIVSGEIDMTSVIVNAAVTSKDGWNAVNASYGDGLVKYGNNAAVDFNQTITLPAGKYKMTAQAAYRYGSGSVNEAEKVEYDAIQAGTPTHYATLYAEVGDKKFETDVQNRWEGRSETDYFNNLAKVSAIVHENVTYYVPNSSSAVKVWFDNGKYVNELVFNVQKAGQVKIGIVKTETETENGDYTNIGAWTLTRLGDAESEPTVGIDCVESVEAAPVVYDLAGRRVEKAVKGIYIVNGKKVVIK